MTAESSNFDLKAVEDALEALALAYHDETRKPEPCKQIQLDLHALSKHDLDLPLPSIQEVYREIIVREPLAGALRLGIRELGIHIWEKTGSADQKQSVALNVTSRHPDKESSLAAIIDHAWNGTGGWFA